VHDTTLACRVFELSLLFAPGELERAVFVAQQQRVDHWHHEFWLVNRGFTTQRQEHRLGSIAARLPNPIMAQVVATLTRPGREWSRKVETPIVVAVDPDRLQHDERAARIEARAPDLTWTRIQFLLTVVTQAAHHESVPVRSRSQVKYMRALSVEVQDTHLCI
jgi:hypothetical protein